MRVAEDVLMGVIIVKSRATGRPRQEETRASAGRLRQSVSAVLAELQFLLLSIFPQRHPEGRNDHAICCLTAGML